MDSQGVQPYGERKREYFEIMRSPLSVEESKYEIYYEASQSDVTS